jgi:AraC family transcriptional regulator of adaptative response/methylated-DNA-[protein]-cysteine methyltransferase
LAEVAAAVGLSEFHFQRLFTRWAGISPKRFLQYLTKQGAKELLKNSNVLDASFGVGLSSPGRLHDLLVNTEAVTPGEIRLRGQGLEIRYGFYSTPFGEALVATTQRGICHLGFVESGRQAALATLSQGWPRAMLAKAEGESAGWVEAIFSGGKVSSPLPVHLSGTNFQLKVWEALLNIPTGQVTNYKTLAAGIGLPGASRAVGTAIGHNPVAVLIPCHRVIRKVGGFGKYRYGESRKQALLGWEAARAQA